MLSTMIPSVTTGTCGTRLRDAVNRACSERFPDLAREMGLGFLGSDNVDDRLLTEGKEDEVHTLQTGVNGPLDCRSQYNLACLLCIG